MIHNPDADDLIAAEAAVRLATSLTLEIRTPSIFTPRSFPSFIVRDVRGLLVRFVQDEHGNSINMVRLGERGELFEIKSRDYDIKTETVFLELERWP